MSNSRQKVECVYLTTVTSWTTPTWMPCLPPYPSLTSAGRRRDPQTWRPRQVTNHLWIICYSFPQEPVSILSGELAGSKDSFEEDRSVTCMDIKLIMPTVCILLVTVFVMVTVIPYAFSAVIKQLQGVWAMEDQSKLIIWSSLYSLHFQRQKLLFKLCKLL